METEHARLHRRALGDEAGSVLIPTLILLFVITVGVASFLSLSSQDVRLTREYNRYKRAMMAAEAGLDKAVIELRNLVMEKGVPTQDELDAITPPDIPGFEFTAPNGQDAFRILIDGEFHREEKIDEGRWAGLIGDYQKYRIRVGVTDESGKGVVLTQGLQRLTIPVFQFGVFYEEDLEILPGPPMVFAGPVHTNDSLYVGCNDTLHFDDKITVHGEVYRHRKDRSEHSSGHVYIMDDDGAYYDMRHNGDYYDHDNEDWAVNSLLWWDGNFIDSAHSVPYLSLPIPYESAPHEIIERSDPDGDESLEENKFENKAALKIWRDSDGEIRAELQDGTEIDVEYVEPVAVGGRININPNNSPHNEFTLVLPDGSEITRDDLHQWADDYEGPATLIHVKPKGNGNQNSFVADGEVLTLRNSETYDIEGDNMQVRLYNDKRNWKGKAMGKWWIEPVASDAIVEENDRPVFGGCIADSGSFGDWREGNGSPRTMQALDIDVEDLINHPEFPEEGVVVYTYSEYADSDETAVIRLKHGEELPEGGLTFATPNPIYVEGDFNTEGDPKPSLVAGDAVNILSNAWDDDDSWDTLNHRKAGNTTVNAVVMTGNTDTSWGDYNGGLENVLRFCESWSGRTLSFRGSIVCMWNSTIATGPWVYGNNRYQAPNRDWGYDEMYRSARNAPPGIPHVYGLEALTWEQSTWTEGELD